MPPLTPLQQGSIRSHYHSTGQVVDPNTGEPARGSVLLASGVSVQDQADHEHVIDLSAIDADMSELIPLARTHERVDGSADDFPGDAWMVGEVWFHRADGAGTGAPDELRIRIHKLSGTGSGYDMRVTWALLRVAD